MERVIAIDFETANHRRDSACAVGLACIEGERVVARAERLIRPPSLDFAPGNVRVHGIRPRDVRDAPTFPEAMAPFLGEIAGALVLAHNASFDVGVLLASLAAYGLRAPAFATLCTVQVSRRTWPEARRHGLAHAAARIGHVFDHHRAGEDAVACASLALAAARIAGVDAVPALIPALGLAPGLAGGAAPARPAPPPPLRARAAGSLAFTVAGRTGSAYAIEVARRGPSLHARCSCPAGRAAMRCRHVTALLDGEVDALTSGNLTDVEHLRRLVLEAGADAVWPQERRRAAA